jgi:mycothiol system anti-sigma-R factor
MSCGNPHELDCGEALAHLYEYIDGEIGPEEHHRIAAHLQECGPCLAEFDVERIVKLIVARSCCALAPGALRAKVQAQIAATVRISGAAPRPDPPG